MKLVKYLVIFKYIKNHTIIIEINRIKYFKVKSRNFKNNH